MKEIPGLKTTTSGYFAQIESLIQSCKEFHGTYRVPLENISFAANYQCESDTEIRNLAESMIDEGISDEQLGGLIGIISKNDTKESEEQWSVLLLEKQNVVSALRYIRCKPKMLEISPTWLTATSPGVPVEIVAVPVGFFRSCSKHLSTSGIHEMRVCMSAVLYEETYVRDTTVLKAVRKIHELKNGETTKHWNDFAKRGLLSTKGSLWMSVFLICSSPDDIFNGISQIVQKYQKENKETKKRLLKSTFMMKVIKMLYDSRKNLNVFDGKLRALEKDLKANGADEIQSPRVPEYDEPRPSSSKETPKRARKIKEEVVEEKSEQETPSKSEEPKAKRSRKSAPLLAKMVARRAKPSKPIPVKKEPPPSASKPPPTARKTRRSMAAAAAASEDQQEPEAAIVVLPDVERAETETPIKITLKIKRTPPTANLPTARRTRRGAEVIFGPDAAPVELPNVEGHVAEEAVEREPEPQEPSSSNVPEEPMDTNASDSTEVAGQEHKGESAEPMDSSPKPNNEKPENTTTEPAPEPMETEDEPTASESDLKGGAVKSMETGDATQTTLTTEESLPVAAEEVKDDETALGEKTCVQSENIEKPEEPKKEPEEVELPMEAEESVYAEYLREPEESKPTTTEEANVDNTEDDTTPGEGNVYAEYLREPEESEPVATEESNEEKPDEATTPSEVSVNADDTKEGEDSEPAVAETSNEEKPEEDTIPSEESPSSPDSTSQDSSVNATDGSATPQPDDPEEDETLEENQEEGEIISKRNEESSKCEADTIGTSEEPETSKESKALTLPSTVELSKDPLAEALSMRVTLESDDLYIIWVEKLDMDLLSSVNMNPSQCILCVQNFSMIAEPVEIRNSLPGDREMSSFNLFDSSDEQMHWTMISFSSALRPLPAELRHRQIESYKKVEDLLEENSKGWELFHFARYSTSGFFPKLADQLKNNILACDYSH